MIQGKSQAEKTINEYIDAHRDEMINVWKTIVSTESPSIEKAQVDKVGQIICRELEAAGASVRTEYVENRGNVLIADWHADAEKPFLIFCGHMDTVFPMGTILERPFTIRDGIVTGPGVLDMKGGLVIAIFVLKALEAAGYREYPVRVVFVGDEEQGHRQSDVGKRLPSFIHGAFAALNFETGFPSGGIVVGRKGSCRLSLDVAGISAHAGNCPEQGRNAIVEMSHKIPLIHGLNDLSHGTSVNVGVISGGTVVNAIPAGCHIDIDIRYTDRTRLDTVLAKIQEISDTNVIGGCSCKVTMQSISMVMEPNEKNHALFEHIRSTAEDIGYGVVTPITSGGWSDSNIISHEGIPVVCSMGVIGEFNHTKKEYALCDSLFERAKLAAVSICRMQAGFAETLNSHRE